MSEKESGIQTEKFQFQAEVANVLDIVINSLYTNKEIFVRELISNSSDALEKIRQISLLEKEIFDKDLPLEISIEVDEKRQTFTITDTGIGMTREELLQDLGTIAHSGSKEFLSRLAEAVRKDVNLIGQFGVGFYSAFMVAKKITVETRSYSPDAQGYEWLSDGAQEFTITPKSGLRRGTKIVLELKPDALDFSKPELIKDIVKRYSNFVSFPILIQNERINTIQAIWTRNKTDVKNEEYTEFFKFIANTIDDPMYHLHFTTDAPIQIYSLLFIPKRNLEQFGLGRLKSGVDLHCRKILIQKHSEEILPEWLRFLYGVIDSEDLPLNISRETLQDNAAVRKIGKIITSRFLKFLDEQSSAEPQKYSEFWKTFGIFIREGITLDYSHKDELIPLLRFESSKTENGKFTSLKEYISRMKDKQNEIYYINGPSREAIESGPYFETFKTRDVEVIYTFELVDDFMLNSIGEYKDKKIISGDSADLDLSKLEIVESKTRDEEALDSPTIKKLCGWLRECLKDKVQEVRESKRLTESPAILVNPDKMFTSTMQKFAQLMNRDSYTVGRKTLEINPAHPLIKNLAKIKDTDEPFAKIMAEQILDNTLINAGLLVDPHKLAERVYKILERTLK